MHGVIGHIQILFKDYQIYRKQFQHMAIFLIGGFQIINQKSQIKLLLLQKITHLVMTGSGVFLIMNGVFSMVTHYFG